MTVALLVIAVVFFVLALVHVVTVVVGLGVAVGCVLLILLIGGGPFAGYRL